MKKDSKTRNELWEWIKAIGIALVLAAGIRYFLFTPIVVGGASMMPTMEDGDKVVVNKIGPKLTEYSRFDVVVFKANEQDNYIKRVIGVPGDHIAYKNDELFINGEKYEESYLDEYKDALTDSGTLTEDFTLEERLGESTVPDGHYFVLGDNRRKSMDSRDPFIGFVEESEMISTAKFVFLPVGNMEIIK